MTIDFPTLLTQLIVVTIVIIIIVLSMVSHVWTSAVLLLLSSREQTRHIVTMGKHTRMLQIQVRFGHDLDCFQEHTLATLSCLQLHDDMAQIVYHPQCFNVSLRMVHLHQQVKEKGVELGAATFVTSKDSLNSLL